MMIDVVKFFVIPDAIPIPIPDHLDPERVAILVPVLVPVGNSGNILVA